MLRQQYRLLLGSGVLLDELDLSCWQKNREHGGRLGVCLDDHLNT